MKDSVLRDRIAATRTHTTTESLSGSWLGFAGESLSFNNFRRGGVEMGLLEWVQNLLLVLDSASILLWVCIERGEKVV